MYLSLSELMVKLIGSGFGDALVYNTLFGSLCMAVGFDVIIVC